MRQQDVCMPEGVILDQIPKADNKIRQNQNVFVTVSKKSDSVMQTPRFSWVWNQGIPNHQVEAISKF